MQVNMYKPSTVGTTRFNQQYLGSDVFVVLFIK